MPRLPNLFTGLCSRLFESGDLMARIAVEQLVDGMNFNDDWIESNLGGATIKVRNLAAQLVLEKGPRHEEDMLDKTPNAVQVKAPLSPRV